jgi:hypothetical protein
MTPTRLMMRAGTILLLMLLVQGARAYEPLGNARENFLADLNRVTEGRIDPELATFLVDNSNASLHWMRRKGIRFEHEKPVPVKGKKYFETNSLVDSSVFTDSVRVALGLPGVPVGIRCLHILYFSRQ